MSTQITQLIDIPEELERLMQDVRGEVAHGGTIYGYVRASSRDETEEAQEMALRTAGVAEERIFSDLCDATGGVSRDGYHCLLRTIQEGDVLIIPSIERLGATYDEVIAQWQLLTRTRGVRVVVLDIPLLDTRITSSQIKDDFIAELALQFLAYVATRERESIRQRQREGILAAKERGVRFGRPPKPIPPQFDALLAQWKNKGISSRKAAQQLGVAQETFLRWARKKG